MAKRLNQKKHRDREGQFCLEGVRVVEDALPTGLVQRLFFSRRLLTTERGKALLGKAKKRGITIWECTEAVLKDLSDTIQSQGIVAVVAKPTWPLVTQGLILVVDEIKDPGNLGTLVRTAVGAGVEGLIIVEGSVDLYNPKVLRATMGAIFHLPHWVLSRSESISLLRQAGFSVVVADLVDADDYRSINYPQNLAVVIGNETKGIHPDFLKAASFRVRIPLLGPIDSLNASVAAGVLLYEILRQKTYI